MKVYVLYTVFWTSCGICSGEFEVYITPWSCETLVDIFESSLISWSCNPVMDAYAVSDIIWPCDTTGHVSAASFRFWSWKLCNRCLRNLQYMAMHNTHPIIANSSPTSARSIEYGNLGKKFFFDSLLKSGTFAPAFEVRPIRTLWNNTARKIKIVI